MGLIIIYLIIGFFFGFNFSIDFLLEEIKKPTQSNNVKIILAILMITALGIFVWPLIIVRSFYNGLKK